MNKITGWLLDLYAHHQEGAALWVLGEDGTRYRLRHNMPVAFYASGPFERLRQLWRYLQMQPIAVRLERTQREDLFVGMITVLAVQTLNAAEQPGLFRDLAGRFPDLDYYDADIPLALRYAVAYDLFPLARCQVSADDEGWVKEIVTLDSRWELDPDLPALRVLTIAPDVDPVHAAPTLVECRCGRKSYRLSLHNPPRLLICLNAILKTDDPDLIITQRGDTWFFPYLLELAERCGTPFNPNRDPERQVIRRKEQSYHTYGQVVYRGQQVHLFGRWHIDESNAMMYGDSGLEGILEQARVTSLPVQEIARKSPGSGITAMQMQTALRRGVLAPVQKQQAERFKSALELIEADFGGLVYQPLIGLYEDVAEIDFISMYPSIMARFNISPETVGPPGEHTQPAPELGIEVDQERTGLVPETLRPLIARRLAIKERLATLNRRDCRYRSYKSRAAALKWLLVVCFGYLGYKNARYGRIESHEAVTAYSREILLQAKETAEGLGYTVLHMYVDGIWVRQAGQSCPADFQPLLEAIAARTHLPIALEGVYRWVAFLPSKQDARVPVPNRYFGAWKDGTLKMRGIEARRRDTPPWIAAVQIEILEYLARAGDRQALMDCLPGALRLLRGRMAELRGGRVALEQLLVSQGLSRELAEYRTPSPAARAAAQLEAIGKPARPGQRIRFLYTRGEPGVHAWDLDEAPAFANLDVKRYRTLLARAISAVLEPLGMQEETLLGWLDSGADLAAIPAGQLLCGNQLALFKPAARSG